MEDVLVIGAGPAGSRAAAILAERGHSVMVIEEHSEAGKNICCTGIVGRECFEYLGATPCALRSATSAIFLSPGGRTIRLDKETPQAYILDRRVLDRSLAERARHAGAQFAFGCSVDEVVRNNGHVEVKCTMGGQPVSRSARALVLACGFNPGLISRFGLGKIGDFAVGAQAEIEVEGAGEVEIWFSREFAPGFFAWIVPVAGNRCLVGVICRKSPGVHLRKFLCRLQEDRRIGSLDVQVKYGRIPLKATRQSCGNRVLAIGDAAGQVKPTTGGGIYYGLLGAERAARVLDAALRDDDLSAIRLSEYQRQWKHLLNGELRVGYLARMAFERLGDRGIDALFDVVQDYGLDKVAIEAEGFSFDWHGRVLVKALAHHAVVGVLSNGLRGVMGRRLVPQEETCRPVLPPHGGRPVGSVQPSSTKEECAARS